MDTSSTKFIILIILTVVVAAVIGFFVWKRAAPTEAPTAPTLGEEIFKGLEEQQVGEALPQTNPFAAETNPFENEANPFIDAYKNPFE